MIREAEYVTIEEAMRLCRVSRRTIYNWLEHGGKLTYVRTAGGAVRIDPTTLFQPGPRPPKPLSLERTEGTQ